MDLVQEVTNNNIAGVTKMDIRIAHVDDLQSIKELWKEMMDFHRIRDEYFARSDEGHERFGEYARSNIESPEWLVMVAVEDEQVIGFSMGRIAAYPPVFKHSHYGFVADIVVNESYRGRGIGRQLFEHMLPWFREQGVFRVEIEVASTNEVSQAFWTRMGFREYMKKMIHEI